MANTEQRTSDFKPKHRLRGLKCTVVSLGHFLVPSPRSAARGQGQGEGKLLRAPPLPSPLLHWRGGEGDKPIRNFDFKNILNRARSIFSIRIGWQILVVAPLLLASCSRSNEGAKQTSSASVPVRVAQARVENVPVKIQAIGTVQAYSVVSVRSQITGPITEMHFEEGQEVKEGDMLFTIDQRPWLAALNQAQANLQRDDAQMINARLQFERTSN